jgi:hypothetical protein
MNQSHAVQGGRERGGAHTDRRHTSGRREEAVTTTFWYTRMRICEVCVYAMEKDTVEKFQVSGRVRGMMWLHVRWACIQSGTTCIAEPHDIMSISGTETDRPSCAHGTLRPIPDGDTSRALP